MAPNAAPYRPLKIAPPLSEQSSAPLPSSLSNEDSGGSSSSQSPMPSQVPGSRSRGSQTVVACMACRKRKSKCSRDRPSCTTCRAKRTSCTYETEEGQTRLEHIRNLNTSLRAENAVLSTDLSSLRIKSSVLESQVTHLEAQNDSLHAQLGELGAQNDILRGQNDGLGVQNDGLRGQLDDLGMVVHVLQSGSREEAGEVLSRLRGSRSVADTVRIVREGMVMLPVAGAGNTNANSNSNSNSNANCDEDRMVGVEVSPYDSHEPRRAGERDGSSSGGMTRRRVTLGKEDSMESNGSFASAMTDHTGSSMSLGLSLVPSLSSQSSVGSNFHGGMGIGSGGGFNPNPSTSPNNITLPGLASLTAGAGVGGEVVGEGRMMENRQSTSPSLQHGQTHGQGLGYGREILPPLSVSVGGANGVR